MSFLSPVNDALSLFESIRDLCHSVSDRIDKFSGNTQEFLKLKDELESAGAKIGICHTTIEKYREAIATQSLQFELVELQRLEKTMQRVQQAVEELAQKQQRKRGPLKRFLRAKAVAQDTSQQVQIIKEVSVQIEKLNETLKGIAQENDIFRADFSSIPALRVPVFLNFNAGDTMEGQLKKKALEIVERSAHNNQTGHAHVTAAVGVSGMGGVGKTTALIGLAQDEDVRKKFSDGIYFVTVGKDATDEKLITSLKELIENSGGEKMCEGINSGTPLESVVGTTSSWFALRKVLFICDDLWKTSSCQTGYFNVLVGLLDKSPKSHMLISTRSNAIACETSARVEFEPRSNMGREARGIFMASAGFDEATLQGSACEELVRQILQRCGGVPLMLSIAGAQVRWSRGAPAESLNGLMQSLVDERLSLPVKQPGQYPSCFNRAVQANLKTISDILATNGEFMTPWNEYSSDATPCAVTLVDFVSDCYRKLCVLPRSARVPGEVISAIWCISNKKVGWSVVDSLVDFHLLLEFKDGHGNPKFGLHDVLLDYCENATQTGENARYKAYHEEFLNHSWKLCYQNSSNTSDVDFTGDDFNGDLDAFWVVEACVISRPWWTAPTLSPKDYYGLRSYLTANLFRHLREAGRLAEAVGLLSHMRWTELRLASGGIVALNADFSLVENALLTHNRRKQDKKACDDTLSEMRNIWDMAKRAWPVVLQNPEALPTHAYGYLLDMKESMPLVQRYLESAVDIVTETWLKPHNAFWVTQESSANGRVFHTSNYEVNIAMVERSKNVIVATSSMLFWVDIETMTAIREMVIMDEQESISAIAYCEAKEIVVLGFQNGKIELRNGRNGNIKTTIPQAQDVWISSLAISRDGNTIVFDSGDNVVRVWDSNNGAPIGDPLLRHNDLVSCVAISGDGSTIASGSKDKSVRIWNAKHGTLIGQPLLGHSDLVSCVAISEDGSTTVSGSRDKTVRVWDTKNGAPIGEHLLGHNELVSCIAISGDGSTIVSGSWDKTVRIWDRKNGTPIGDPLLGHNDLVSCIAISRDGSTIVSGSWDKTVRKWDRRNGAPVGDRLCGHDDDVRCVAMSGDGSTIVSGSWDKTVRVWDTKNGAPIGDPLRGHDDDVLCVAISGDGSTIVSGSDDKTVRLWNSRNGIPISDSLLRHEDEVRCTAISGDGSTIACGFEDGSVRVWNVRSGALIGEALLGHENSVVSVAVNADGQTVVSADMGASVIVWRAATGTKRYDSIMSERDFASSVSVSSNGLMFVSASWWDKSIQLFERRKSQWVCFSKVAIPRQVENVYYLDYNVGEGQRPRVACHMGGTEWLLFDVMELENETSL